MCKRVMLSLTIIFSSFLLLQIQAQTVKEQISHQQIKQILHRLEARADRFKISVNRLLSESSIDGTSAENSINKRFQNFKSIVKELRERFDDNDLIQADIKAVFDSAIEIDNFMQHNWRDRPIQRDWLLLKSDLNILARALKREHQWSNGPKYTGIVQQSIDKRELASVSSSLTIHAADFRELVDRVLDKSAMDGSKDEDNINKVVKEFSLTCEDLQRRANLGQSGTTEAETILSTASRIDIFMQRNLSKTRAEILWTKIKNDLNRLAGLYQVRWNWSNKTYSPIALRTTPQKIEKGSSKEIRANKVAH
jgi:hypothetical protein